MLMDTIIATIKTSPTPINKAFFLVLCFLSPSLTAHGFLISLYHIFGVFQDPREKKAGGNPFARSATSLGEAHIIAKHIICTKCNIVGRKPTSLRSTSFARSATSFICASQSGNDVELKLKWCCPDGQMMLCLAAQMKKSWKHCFQDFLRWVDKKDANR